MMVRDAAGQGANIILLQVREGLQEIACLTVFRSAICHASSHE